MEINNTVIKNICRYLILSLLAAVVFVVWNGNMTAIEIKDIVVQIVCLIVLGISAIRVLMKEKIIIPLNPLVLLVAVYGLLMFCAFLSTNRTSINYTVLIPQIFGIIIFFLVITYFNRNDIQKLTLLCVIVAGVASLYGILQYFDADPVNWIHLERRYKVISFFGHKNYFAIYLLLMIPLGLYLSFSTDKRPIRYAAIASTGIMAVALVLSNSRGALVCFFICGFISTLLFILLKKSQAAPSRKTLGIVFAVPIIIAFTVLLLPKPIKDDFAQLLTSREYLHRVSYYHAAGEIIGNNPFFGVGPGNFVISYPQNVKYKTWTEDPNRVLNHVHNDFLEIWVEYGIFALLAYLGIVLLLGYRLLKHLFSADNPHQKLLLICVFCSLAGYLCYSNITVAPRYMSSAFFLWVVVSIGYLQLKENFKTKSITIVNRLRGRTKFTGISVVLIVLVLGGLGKTALANYVSNVYVHKASVKTIKGDYKGALEYLEKAISLRKKEVEAYYQRGYVHFNMNLFDQAIDDYEQVQRLAPNYVNIAFNTASCYYRKHDWVNAIKYAAISHDHFPGYEANTVMLAFCYYYIRQPQVALEYCEKVLQINSDNQKILDLKKNLKEILQRS